MKILVNWTHCSLNSGPIISAVLIIVSQSHHTVNTHWTWQIGNVLSTHTHSHTHTRCSYPPFSSNLSSAPPVCLISHLELMNNVWLSETLWATSECVLQPAAARRHMCIMLERAGDLQLGQNIPHLHASFICCSLCFPLFSAFFNCKFTHTEYKHVHRQKLCN